MNESALRRVLLVIAILGLAVGVGVWKTGLGPLDAGTIWMAATLPVVAVLAISILRDFWIGRFGVDAIALVSMSAALLLGQPLAAVVVAIIYAGGTVLEDFARGRAERNLKALTDRSPRVAHRKSTQETETISVDEVAVGNELLVRAGELLPVDGILLDPSASLDEFAVTGEPLSVRRIARDALRSGTSMPASLSACALQPWQNRAPMRQSCAWSLRRRPRKPRSSAWPTALPLFLLPATLLVSGAAWYISGDPIRALAVLVGRDALAAYPRCPRCLRRRRIARGAAS